MVPALVEPVEAGPQGVHGAARSSGAAGPAKGLHTLSVQVGRVQPQVVVDELGLGVLKALLLAA